MAIKKYISPDSYKGTIKDNYRKLAGQYWYKDTNGNLVYGENMQILPGIVAGSGGTGMGNAGDVYSQDLVLTVTPETSFESSKELSIRRRSLGLGDWVTGYSSAWEYGLYRTSFQNEMFLAFQVEGTADDYLTLTRFSDDLANVFQNPSINGVEDFFYEESFQYEHPHITDTDYSDLVSVQSEYNFFDENYENLTSTVQEAAIPNFYAVSMIANSGVNELISTWFDVANHATFQYYFSPGESIDQKILQDKDYKEYISEWAKKYTQLTSEQTKELETKGKNIISTIGIDDRTVLQTNEPPWWEIVNSLSDEKDEMPFYIRLNIKSENVLEYFFL